MRRLGVVVVALLALSAGCATGRQANEVKPPAVDLTGRWTGQWIGYGIVDIPREEAAVADLVQHGATGEGRLVLEGTDAAESIPVPLRRAGATGARVVFEVSGSDVVMTHELGGGLFTIDFAVEGDRMVGHMRDSDLPLRLELVRARPARAEAEPVEVAEASEPPAVEAAPEPAPEPEPTPVAEPAEEPRPEPAIVASAPLAATEEPTVPAMRPEPKEFTAIPEVRTIHFAFDSATLRPGDMRILDANAEWLKANRGAAVLIEGHCDERGTNEYNLALGERRARAARDYLISRGVAADRLTVVSYGEERPLCQAKTEACWSDNRRAHFLVKPE